jgi:outer membrane protein TolC
MRALWLLPFAISMVACSLTPSMVMPPSPVPAAFPGVTDEGKPLTAARLNWQTVFIDPHLQQAIGLALFNNRDLRLAMLNVDIARSQYDIARAARLPAIDATVSSVRQRGGDTGTATPGTTGQQAANIGMLAFEIDLFGRVHALSEAAFARYLATEAGYSAARLALIAAVADAYLADRFSDAQLALAERTPEDWRRSLSLALARHAAGQSGGLGWPGWPADLPASAHSPTSRRRQCRKARRPVGHALPRRCRGPS